MKSFNVNKKNEAVPHILQVKDWLKQNRKPKKLCIYCGTKEPRMPNEYCSEECEKQDSVWQFSN